VDLFWETIKKNNWLVVALAVITSFVFPSFGFSLKSYSNYLLMLLVFLSCLDLKIPEIISSFRDYRSQVLILVITHLISPLLILPFRPFLSPEIYLGLIITAVSPVGRSTAFLVNIYGGYPIKALVSSTVSNALSPIIMPAVVWLFAHQFIEINVANMSSTIFWLVVVPIIFAYFIGKTKPGVYLNKQSSGISVLVLFFILNSIIAPLKNTIFANPTVSILISIIGIYLLVADFFLGYKIGRNPKDQITFGITSAYKNYTLATILAMTLFGPTVTLAPIIYSITNNLLLIPLSLSQKHLKNQ
jgi:BASS family bile acid:Na+ symporter